MAAKPEITDLTCCRGLLALWVFAYHVDLHAQFALGPFAGLLHRGYLGVDGFFILSGIILARVHPELSRSMSTSVRFWARRLARIYPVHFATIVLLGLLVLGGAAMGMTPSDPSRFSPVSLIENLLLIQGWGFGNSWSWNYPSWSLSSEWAGYLLFPVLWFCLGRWQSIVVGQVAIIAFPILGLIAFLSGHGLNVSSADALPRFFVEFIWGICAARMVPIFADNLPSASLALAGFVMVLIGALLGFDTFVAAGLWFALSSLTMHADAERQPLFRHMPLLRIFGLLSYSFYMSFATIELILAQIFRHETWDPAANKLIYTLAMFLLTLMLSIVLFIAVERPCRRTVDRWLSDPEPLAATRLRM